MKKKVSPELDLFISRILGKDLNKEIGHHPNLNLGI